MTDQRNSSSSWTLETLHEHIGEVCRMNEKRIDERFAAMEKATALGMKTAAAAALSLLGKLDAMLASKNAAEV